MTLWFWIVVACVVGFLTKLLGYLVPKKWLANPRVARIAGTLTIGLLASLTVANSVATGQQLVLDARLGALVAAAVALWLKAPFLVVVIVGAAAAAGLRLLGLP
ncbi:MULTISPECIES: AzlD domain-containing protein [Cryobacterium]|uniref:Branched-chain amino acid transporter AzlD n=1 Tax=Cryobacterium zongtaii TaxID=1259217 RepID=A0A2S3ZBW6_9MICO|nr:MULTISPECIES: AzlD domain-containing protein [Cryobacterium]POH63390.1 branched-chain amino acid transporter AzlD [Cryobacterium zongtaii]POH70905.1 branched-chain amino acid transporter AzlD [Cryobacterium zongtaii]TFC47202.1 AzlD domain-containing protein [Cryobacterium sp. TMN-39-2]TFC52725.1 AzlD domain-containing protein [Cryobacterium sp. TMB3-1-2]TFC68328.1 AzlD domain-containing protein [Cryobacterium sp. TMB3-15]